MASPLISAVNVSKSFAGRSLFKNLSLSLYDGERSGLLGPNGAGKSTLMGILARELDPDSGEVIAQKGVRVGYLQQTPKFAKGLDLLTALLGPDPEHNEKLSLAYEWLSRLELIQFGEYSEVSSLSGGWQKRLALACELIKEPKVLLLDEPTNHLDVSSILWLEEFLSESSMALLMITHDRLFLQRVCNCIFDLDPRNPDLFHRFDKDYISYLEEKDLMLQAQAQRFQASKNTLSREKEWLARGAKARQTKQKARIERAHELTEDVAFLKEKNRRLVASIEFSDSARVPKKLVDLKAVTCGYGEKILFKNFTYTLSGKARLGLLGDNGVGKSSFAKLLIGQLEPLAGTVDVSEKIQVAYFEQHKQTLREDLSVLRNVCSDGDYVHLQGQPIFAKSYLEKFLFRYDQMDLPVAKLSGGEKSRLRIAQLMLQDSNLLILDEPTNDLDVTTLDVLQQALLDFQGAVVLVTHDRYFLDQVTNEILAFEANAEGDAGVRIEKFQTYFQWEKWHADRPARDKAAAVAAKEAALTEKKSGKSRLSFKEKFELEGMEASIAKLEGEIKQLDQLVAKPENMSQATLLAESYAKMGQLQGDLEKMFARWQELTSRNEA